jgi:hypothetical protein
MLLEVLDGPVRTGPSSFPFPTESHEAVTSMDGESDRHAFIWDARINRK